MTILTSISTSYPAIPAYTSDNCHPCEPSDGSPEMQKSTEKKAETAEKQHELTEEEKQQVQKLQARDREVRSHEMAHIAAGGQYVRGGANFEFQTGPDGKRYAVGGEVSIDTSAVSDNPDATVQKMQVVRKAALAPSQPSEQDRVVAAQASQKEIQARQELKEEPSNENNVDSKQPTPNKNTSFSNVSLYSEDGTTHFFQHTTLAKAFDITA